MYLAPSGPRGGGAEVVVDTRGTRPFGGGGELVSAPHGPQPYVAHVGGGEVAHVLLVPDPCRGQGEEFGPFGVGEKRKRQGDVGSAEEGRGKEGKESGLDSANAEGNASARPHGQTGTEGPARPERTPEKDEPGVRFQAEARVAALRARRGGTVTFSVNTTPTRTLTLQECLTHLQPFKLAIVPARLGDGTAWTNSLIDPGAQLSLIGQDTVSALRLETTALPPAYRLQAGTWGSEAHAVEKVVETTVTLLGNTQPCTLLVVPQMDTPVLLGLDSLHKLGVVVDCPNMVVTCRPTKQEFRFGHEGGHVKVNQIWVKSDPQECTWTVVVAKATLLFRHESPVELVLRTNNGEQCDYTGPVAMAIAKEATDVGLAVQHAVTYAVNGRMHVALPHLGDSMEIEPGSCLGLATPYDSDECITTVLSRKNGLAQLARLRMSA